MVPIFPELEPFLRTAFELAKPGDEYVITRYRSPAANLRTQLTKIIRRAGLEPWPKLWQNLRATRETELAEQWPGHVVTKWVGHSQIIAQRHYLQVPESYYEAAAKPAQNPAQYPPVADRITPHASCETPALEHRTA